MALGVTEALMFGLTLPTLFSVVLGCIVIAIMWCGRTALRETTLMAPCYWAVTAIATIVAADLCAESLGRSGAAFWQFIAAAFTFCPPMAVLGAKRPQHIAWQFIVLALWLTAILPVLETALRGRGEVFEVSTVRSWFLLILIVVGVVNYLPTRFAAASLLYGGAQATLFWAYLPFGSATSVAHQTAYGLGLFVAALFMAAWSTGRNWRAALHERERRDDHLTGLNYVWREFRDWFGLVWGLRIIERVNASAAMYGWNLRLDWHGLHATKPDGAADNASSDTVPEAQVVALEQSLRTLLRRFVSREWIDRRLARDDLSAAS